MWRASRPVRGYTRSGRPAGRAQPSGRARARVAWHATQFEIRVHEDRVQIQNKGPSPASLGKTPPSRAAQRGGDGGPGGSARGGRRAAGGAAPRPRRFRFRGSVCVTGKRTYLNLPLADPHIRKAARGSVGLFPQLPLKPPTTKRVSAAVRPERYRYRKLGTNSIAADQRGIQIPPLHPTLATGGPSPRRQASRPRAASPRGGQPPAP